MQTNLKSISPKDSIYPELLKNIYDPPKRLYYLGNISILERQLLSIVGTRKHSAIGRREATRIAEFCAAYGLVSVSGLAMGIDALVHSYSLELGVPTVAVLPGSIELPYPATNRDLARDIIAAGGVLITERPELTKCEKYTFPRRNRIIAGLSKATVVIEGHIKSGALLTANSARVENRSVFAVPGEPTFESFSGNQLLLEQDIAKPITLNYKQLREDLGISPSEGYNASVSSVVEGLKGLQPIERAVAQAILAGQSTSSDISTALAEYIKKDPQLNLSLILARMQLNGLILKDAFGRLTLNVK